jgi:hypothetical protein
MQRVRLSHWFPFAAAAALALAACNVQTAEPTLDATSIIISVQQSQTAAAQSTGPAAPPATSAPPSGEATQAPPADTPAAPSDTPAAPGASPTEAVSATATSTATETPGPTNTPGAGPVGGPTSSTPGEPGTITGALGYPSESIPRLKVYAWDRGSGQWRYIITNPNDDTYALQVPPGKYIVFAYLNDGGDIAGGYTNAVLCGLTAACTDHSLYLVTVGSGQQVSGVNVTDWYGPPGSIPQPPA